jgi:hypothetical protein
LDESSATFFDLPTSFPSVSLTSPSSLSSFFSSFYTYVSSNNTIDSHITSPSFMTSSLSREFARATLNRLTLLMEKSFAEDLLVALPNAWSQLLEVELSYACLLSSFLSVPL